jgi:hypothetical protein
VGKAILPKYERAVSRAELSAVNGDGMKPPDGIEQHRQRMTRNDDGLGDLVN